MQKKSGYQQERESKSWSEHLKTIWDTTTKILLLVLITPLNALSKNRRLSLAYFKVSLFLPSKGKHHQRPRCAYVRTWTCTKEWKWERKKNMIRLISRATYYVCSTYQRICSAITTIIVVTERRTQTCDFSLVPTQCTSSNYQFPLAKIIVYE